MPPLTPDEFEARKGRVGTAISWFLRTHAPIAFSSEEIMVELGALSIFFELDAIEGALRLLLERETIDSVPANGTIYYRQVRSFGFRPPRT